MKNTVQIDWFGKKFEEFSDENMNCFIKAYQEEDFTEKDLQYPFIICAKISKEWGDTGNVEGKYIDAGL